MARKAKEKGLVEGKDGESTARWDQDQITEMMVSANWGSADLIFNTP